MSLTLPAGQTLVQFLNVEFVKSVMYPVAQLIQFLADETHPEQLTSQVVHLLVVESGKVPEGQLTEVTQVFVFEFKNVVEGHEVQVRASIVQVAHDEVH